MERLPEEFKKDQYDYRQVCRTDAKAIYAQGYKSEDGNSFDIVSYEVIRIRKQEPGIRMMGEATIEYKEKELYPTTEQWGTHGWTFIKLENAMRRYNAIS